MDKDEGCGQGAMALTCKEDDSRSGKRAAIYRGVAEQVGHGISENPYDKMFINTLALIGAEARPLNYLKKNRISYVHSISYPSTDK